MSERGPYFPSEEMPNWLRYRAGDIEARVNAMLERGESINGIVLFVGGPDGESASLMTAGGPVDVRCDRWCPLGYVTTAWMCPCGSLFMFNGSRLGKCESCLRANPMPTIEERQRGIADRMQRREALASEVHAATRGAPAGCDMGSGDDASSVARGGPSKHGPGGRGGPGPCDPDCAKCAREGRGYKLGDAVTWQGIGAGIHPPDPVHGIVSGVVNGRVTEMLADNWARYDVTVCPSGLRPRDPVATPKPVDPPVPVDPLDVMYDGWSLRDLLAFDYRARRENVIAQTTRSCFTPVQRAAVSAHWSAELRAKVAASKSADQARAPSVYCQGDWDDEVAW